MRTLILAAALAISGCGNDVKIEGDGWMGIQTSGGAAGIKEITMPSGRRCVVLVGYYKGALSCDWSN